MGNFPTIILAAGKGTRMKSKVPKILHPVCGKPLIQYVIDTVSAVGSLKICVVIGHQAHSVKKYLGNKVTTIVQKKLLGTADAVKIAGRYLRNHKGNVLVLCGDTPLLNKNTIKQLIQCHQKSKAICTFLTAFVEDSTRYGRVIRDEKGSPIAIREEKDASRLEKNINEINVGVYCFKGEELLKGLEAIKVNPRKKEYYLTDIIDILSKRGKKIETVTTQDHQEGIGVNTREDLAFVESVVRKRILENFMRQGVTIVDPLTTYIDADAKIGQDTVIRPFTVIENSVRIGRRCIIGPFARLRPGTRIGNNAEVGNFAEISRSELGDYTLMKHFSFLGDAQVGSRVNIGAGTVTANYDGRRKNKTRIRDGAFIGSDSILVAPVTIGKKAITGAGCVVTKGKVVPDKGVVVGVPAKLISKSKR